MTNVRKVMIQMLVILVLTNLSYSVGNTISHPFNVSKVLTITAMFAMNEYSATFVATKLALEHINLNPDILPGYYLNMSWKDTQCDPSIGLKNLFDELSTPPIKIMALGASCSHVTEQVTRFTKEFKLLQVSPSSSSPVLSSKSVYPYFFRTIVSGDAFPVIMLDICRKFGWKRVSILNEKQEFFTAGSLALIKTAETRYQISVASSQEVDSDQDPYLALLTIRKTGNRVILAGFLPEMGRKIFCQAYHMDMTSPNYIWIIPDSLPKYWWRIHGNVTLRHSNKFCGRKEMDHAVKGYFSVSDYPIATKLYENTVSGFTPSKWLKVYKEYQQKHYPNYTANEQYAGYAYDAVWCIALSLNNSIRPLHKNHGTKLEKFVYHSSDFIDTFVSQMEELKFMGISGSVSFTFRGNRIGAVRVGRIQGSDLQNVEIAIYATFEESPVWKTTAIQWGTPGNSVPKDRPTSKIMTVSIPLELYVAIAVSVLVSVSIASCTLIFNIRFNKILTRCIVNSKLNSILAIAAIICCSCIFLLASDKGIIGYNAELTKISCWSQSIILCLGFSIGYGALLAKIWDIYKIQTTAEGKLVRGTKNWQLYLMVFLVCVGNLLVVILFSVTDPIVIAERNYTEINADISAKLTGGLPEESLVTYIARYCVYQYSNIRLAVVSILNGILLIIGIVLSWKARAVVLPISNEAKYVGFSIYNVALFSIIGSVLSVTTQDRPVSNFGLTSLFILVIVFVTMFLSFLPRIYYVWKVVKANKQKAHESINDDRESATMKYHDEAKIKRRLSQNEVRNEIDRLNTSISQLVNQAAVLRISLHKADKQVNTRRISTLGFVMYEKQPSNCGVIFVENIAETDSFSSVST
ncbi:Gamma-aminobutyric acid type B receptor subunit 2 [Trichoplax sp. H2]|nr:Gamma-aminobutyric acid type B receptor subunit 2 [Trichoplax sp. H2]|eukprot:RDD41771.1 Gamma-aminobutyric acid type B receptor subunit 2 [Trichoplax sp. H2]